MARVGQVRSLLLATSPVIPHSWSAYSMATRKIAHANAKYHGRSFPPCSPFIVIFAAPAAVANSLAPQLGGGVENGADDLVVAGAAAEVAGEPVARLGFRRIRIAVQQGLGRDQHARRAEAALQRRMLEEFPLQRVEIMALAPCPRSSRSRDLRPRPQASGTSRPGGRRPSRCRRRSRPSCIPLCCRSGASSSRSTSSSVSCGSHRNSVGSPLMVVDT